MARPTSMTASTSQAAAVAKPASSLPPPPATSLPALRGVRALTFDVFGTVVDWRPTVERELREALQGKLGAAGAEPSLSSPAPPSAPSSDQGIRSKIRAAVLARGSDGAAGESAAALDRYAAALAARWRASYAAFTRGFAAGGATPWVDVDAHHRASLEALLGEDGLAGEGGAVFTSSELDALAMVWHRLPAWPDVREGMRRLRAAGVVTASLSNGNRSLLRDLDSQRLVRTGPTQQRDAGPGPGPIGFQRILSAEDFGAYKPAPAVYLGAVAALVLEGGGEGDEGGDAGPDPARVAMVAAHLGDLAGARACGMRTVYVERKGEEEWKVGEERHEEAKGWVDVWIAEGDGGFVELARRMGITEAQEKEEEGR